MGQIYIIMNETNGKCYVGQTVNTFAQRYGGPNGWAREHNHNPILKKSAKKHGIENFTVWIVEDGAFAIAELNQKEAYWADLLNSYVPSGYNLKGCGDNRRHNEQTKQKLSKLGMGRKSNDKQRAVAKEYLGKKVKCSDGRVFASIRDAAKATGLGFNVVWCILHGHATRKTNLDFAFEADSFRGLVFKGPKSQMISCSNGQKYASIRAAARELGLQHNGIIKVLKGTNRHCGGLTFKYCHGENPQ